jgi:hypothetical protein
LVFFMDKGIGIGNFGVRRFSNRREHMIYNKYLYLYDIMAIGIKSKIEKINNEIDGIKIPLFIATLFIWHLLYFLIFFGLVYIDPSYVYNLSVLIQLFICGFLLIRFHPFREYEISRFDGMVIFTSTTFLLTNLLTTELLAPYLPAIENYLKGKASGLLNHTFGGLSSQKKASNTSMPNIGELL